MFLLTRAPSEERSIKALAMYDTTMSLPALDAMIKDHELGKPFKATEVSIPQDECASWVKFRIEPQRFLPANFDGDWANTKLHPIEGKIRVIRIVTGNDSVSRVIGRQGSSLFAYPWFR
jgi:hypothetical protein